MFSTIQDLQEYYDKLLTENQKLQWEKDSLIKQKAAAEQDVLDNKAKLQQLYEFRNIFQDTATQSREYARDLLQSIVTTALQYIFGIDYSCRIVIPNDSLKPEAYIYIVQDCNGTMVQTEPVYGRGGGIVDVVSLALRAAMVQLQNDPPTTGPIILDEPGKMVSAQHGAKLAEFISYLSKELNRQIILTTHNMDLAASATKVFVADMIANSTVISET